MEDITELFNSCRECSRHVWNTHFRFLEDGDALFWPVEEALFNQLVLSQIDKPPVKLQPNWSDGKPLSYVRVIPNAPHGTPVMINRTGDGGYWDDPIDIVKPDEVDLRFLEFFDFAGMQDYRDWQYYRVRIESFASQKHLEGRDLLVQASYASVFCSD